MNDYDRRLAALAVEVGANVAPYPQRTSSGSRTVAMSFRVAAGLIW
jgi:hypothetical protein